jgi:two-component system phosphate regulon sensor histidine kinase PhoR
MADSPSHIDIELARVMLESSPNGILVTDAEGYVRVINRAMGDMLPLVPNAIGRSPIEVVPQPDLADALRSDRSDEVEFTLVSGNRDLYIRVVSMQPEGGRLALVQDVTTLRRAEQYRSEFVANVSHELRTPATAIVGYAETLLEDRDTLDPYVVDMVEVIFRNAKRLNLLFEDLLTLSRLDARDGPLPMTSVQLLPIVVEAMDKVRPQAEAKRIHFEVLVSEDMRVHGNRDALGHVVGNLVSNAVKYSFDTGVVTVRAQYRERFVLLEVIDVGMGIGPVHLKRIFERFYRVDKGRARAVGGTGLGLAIVQKLVEAMGAAIEVRSRPGDGSVFRVLLEPPREPPSRVH